MKEKFEYRFDKSTRILYKTYHGSITLDDIFKSWDEVILKGLVPKETVGFILDYRGANFNIQIKEYTRIPDYYKQHLDIFGGLRIAIVTTSRKDIIIPTLVEFEDEGYYSRPFYTIDAAVNWVLS